MGKKKIKILYILLLSSICIYSQEKLQWVDSGDIAKELYISMGNFIEEEIQFPKKKIDRSTNFYNYVYDILTRKKRKKDFMLQIQNEKEQIKVFMDTHFIVEDSNIKLVFFSKEQIEEWNKKSLPVPCCIGYVISKEFCIKNKNIFITLTERCSGMSCLSIDVYKENNGLWQLMTSSFIVEAGEIIIKVDNETEKFLFETLRNGKIGELSFTEIGV